MNTESSSTLSSVPFPLKAYTVAQLSVIYGVSKKTFRRWIEPISESVGEKQGYFYNISQIKTIVTYLGVPGNIQVH